MFVNPLRTVLEAPFVNVVAARRLPLSADPTTAQREAIDLLTPSRIDRPAQR